MKFLLSLLALALVLTANGAAQPPIGSVGIVDENLRWAIIPGLSGNTAVFVETRGSGYMLYALDIDTKVEETILNVPYAEAQVRLSGRRAVFVGYQGLQADVSVIDIGSSSVTRITADAAFQNVPDIDGDIVVWQDYRNGGGSSPNADIYAHDLSTGESRAVTNAPGYQSSPAVSGRRVVWQDYRNAGPGNATNADIYLLDLEDGAEKPIVTHAAYQASPDIWGDRIVWEDARTDGGDIYMYDLGTGVEQAICTAAGYQGSPVISGDWIVWLDYRAGGTQGDLYGYNLAAEREYALVTQADHQDLPQLDGNRLVWQDYRGGRYDLYAGTLTLYTRPATPQLIAPADRSTNVAVAPALRWDQIPGASSYQLQIDSSEDFSSPVAEVGSLYGGSTVAPELDGGSIYHWRVRAIASGINSLWSPVWRFTTLMRAPLPTTPEHDTSVPPSTQMVWGAVRGSVGYRLQIASDSAFMEVIVDTVGAERQVSVDGLEIGATFWWRARAIGRDAESNWSPARSFTVVLAPPAAVTLLAPASGSIVPDTIAELRWMSAADALDYRVLISEQPDFTTLLLDTAVAATSLRLVGLEVELEYWWRVLARNAAGEGAEGEAWSFSSNGPASIRTAHDGGAGVLIRGMRSGASVLELDMQRAQRVRVRVVDIHGATLAVPVDRVLPAGRISVDLATDALAEGSYFVLVEKAGVVHAHRLMILR